MNYLEISKILEKMVNDVRNIDINIQVNGIKNGLIIDKNDKK